MTRGRLTLVVALCAVLVVGALPAPGVGPGAPPADAALDGRTPTAERVSSQSIPTPPSAVDSGPVTNEVTSTVTPTPTSTSTPAPTSTPTSTDTVTLSGAVEVGAEPVSGGELRFVSLVSDAHETVSVIDGTYQSSLEPATTYQVVYVQAATADGLQSPDDSTPDFHVLGTVETPESSDDEQRNFTLPVANDLFIEVTNGNEPVENASVELTFGENDGDGESFSVHGKTITSGQFLLSNATNSGIDVSGGVTVSVTPPADSGLQSANRSLDVSTDTTERFDLSTVNTVNATATVTNPDGEPASNVTVVWTDTGGTSSEVEEYVTATTDADGQAGPVDLVSNREYLPVVVQGTHDGGWEQGTSFDDVADFQTFSRVNESTDFSRAFTLSRAQTTLDVRVVNRSGDPVENASVLVAPKAVPIGPIGETDGDGRTVIDGREQPGTELAPGAYRIRVAPNVSSDLPLTNRTVYIPDDFSNDSFVVVGLVERSTVTGSLVDSSGAAIDSGRVVAVPRFEGAGFRTADDRLSPEGTFRITPWRNSSQFVGYVQYEGSNRDGLPDVLTLAGSSFADAQYEAPEVTVPAGHLVTVNVTDESGEPVEDARVRVTHTGLNGGILRGSEAADGYAVFDTDAQGRLAPVWYDEVGLELTGNVTVAVTPPQDAGFVETTFRRELQVDGRESLQFELERVEGSSDSSTTDTDDDSSTTDTDDGSSELALTGTAPELSVDSSLAFGDVPTGAPVDRVLSLSNDGDAPLSVDHIDVVSGDDVFTVDAEETVVAPGESEQLTVSFDPVSPGTETGTLLVEHNGSSPTRVDLTGTGVESPLAATPTSLSFGNVSVGQSANETLTLTNEGDAPVDLGSVTAVNASGVEVVTAGDTTLAPGESRTLTVRFAPESRGDLTGRLRLQDGDGAFDVPLSGHAVAPSLAVETNTVAFENTTTDDRQTQSVTVRNDGDATLTVSDVRFVGPTPDAFTTNVSTFTVAPGESRQFSVSFSPDAPGPYSATLSATTDDPTQPRAKLWVSNTGTVVETNATRPARNVTTVNVSVENATAGQTVAVDVSTAETVDDSVAVDSLAVDVAEDGSFTLNVSSGTSPTVTNSSFNLSDGTIGLGYVHVDHSIPDEDIDGVTFDFRVRKETLRSTDTPADEVVLHRYSNGTWSKLPTTVVSESETYYVLRGDSPGLSDFVVGGEQAKFRLLRALVGVETVDVGDEVAVRVRITNVGGADGSYTAALLFNGDVVAERDVTIAANGTRQSTFERSIGEPGQYAIRVNDEQAGNVTVELPDNGTATGTLTADGSESAAQGADTGSETERTQFALPGFGVVPALVALLVSVVALAVRRRPR